MRRWIDLALGIALLAGALLAWRAIDQRARLDQQFETLFSTVPELPQADPTLVAIRAFQTREPMHYAWRIHLPPNYNLELHRREAAGSSGSSAAGSSGQTDGLGRIRFAQNDDGRLEVFTVFGPSKSLTSIGDAPLGRYLTEHWADLEIEQIATNRAVLLRPDESAVILRIRLPRHLHAEASKQFRGYVDPNDPLVFELILGKEKAEP